MKKRLTAILFVLLAGSSLVQSCKKPDALPDPAPNPTVPIVPVDSSKTNEPIVPLTEQQIIQKAIEKLRSDQFVFTGFNRNLVGVQSRTPASLFTHCKSSTDYSIYPPYFGNGVSVNRLITAGNAPKPKSIYCIKSDFYNKIFVNIEGDSFIGVTNRVNDLADSNYIVSSNFSNMEKYKTLLADSNTTWLIPDNFPSVEVQYYFNKDSLVIFGAVSTIDTRVTDSFVRSNTLSIFYGRKKK